MQNTKQAFETFRESFLDDDEVVTHSSSTLWGTRTYNGCPAAVEDAIRNKCFGGAHELVAMEFSYHDSDFSQLKGKLKQPEKRTPALLKVIVKDQIFQFHVNADDAKDIHAYLLMGFNDRTNTISVSQKSSNFPELLADAIAYEMRYELMTVEERQQVDLLESLPKPQYNWLPPHLLPKVVTAISKKIQSNPSYWLQMSKEVGLGANLKYINIRVDQRTGDFIVSGDKHQKMRKITDQYPDHMYPQGWDSSCDVNPRLLGMVIDLEYQNGKIAVDKLDAKNKATIIEKHIKDMIATGVIEIEYAVPITPEQLMTAYGKKI